MKNYVLKEIYIVDGYERHVAIEEINSGNRHIVHFLECDEYLEDNEQTKKRKIGDVLKGNIFIDLVCDEERTDRKIMHWHPMPRSSDIEAVVEVFQVIDDYSIYAFSSISDEKILVEFEHKVSYQKGDIIFVGGSLELEMEE